MILSSLYSSIFSIFELINLFWSAISKGALKSFFEDMLYSHLNIVLLPFDISKYKLFLLLNSIIIILLSILFIIFIFWAFVDKYATISFSRKYFILILFIIIIFYKYFFINISYNHTEILIRSII